MSERFSDDGLRAAYAPKLHESSGDHEPTCPGVDALLAALRGEGVEAERLRVLDQALRCAACRRELALLHAVSGGGAREHPVTARGGSWRRFVPLAAAASIVLAVGLFGVDRWRERPDSDITRGGGASGGELTLLAPRADSVLVTGPVTFIWRPVGGALRYTLEVSSADGTVLFTTETADTVVAMPTSSRVSGGNRWSVRAYMDDGSERRSEFRPVRLP